MFLLVFNLHISKIIESKEFLGSFLFLGNISMAVGGLLFGHLIDKYNKGNLLLITTASCALFFLLESFVSSPLPLYFISVFYGLGYSMLMSIHGPFIIDNAGEEEQPYVFNICSSCKLFGITCGTVLGGILPRIELNRPNGSPYQFLLLIAAIIYFLACIPLLFLRKNKISAIPEKAGVRIGNRKKLFHKKSKIEILTMCSIYLILGLLIFLSPYLNLYLEKRFALNLLTISWIIAVIQVCPIITNILLTLLYKVFSIPKIILYGSLLCTASYLGMAFISHIGFQIVFIIIVTIAVSFLIPLVNNVVLKSFDSSMRGAMSGVSNFWYNAGDAIGTYSEGLFISYGLYRLSFSIVAFLYIILLFLTGIFSKKKREQ